MKTVQNSTQRKSSIGELSCGELQLPVYEPFKVKLQTRTYLLNDAAFSRRYLVERREKKAKFAVGDLVWARSKKCPWWPAMVSVHPQRDNYCKFYKDSDDVSFCVQFFGSFPYFGWIGSGRCRPFNGFGAFHRAMNQHLQTCAPSKKRKIYRQYEIPKTKKESMNVAIAEAEAASKLSAQERIKLLTYRFYSTKYYRFYD